MKEILNINVVPGPAVGAILSDRRGKGVNPKQNTNKKHYQTIKIINKRILCTINLF